MQLKAKQVKAYDRYSFGGSRDNHRAENNNSFRCHNI